jgi:hypothetical protein
MLGEKHVVHRALVDCLPCPGKKCEAPDCMEKIPLNDVLHSAEMILGSVEKPHSQVDK